MDAASTQRTRNNVRTPAPDEIRITRVFNAPRELVWRAWTSPAMLVHWFGCAAFSTIDAEADVRVGGHWRVVMRAPDGVDYPAYGEYTAVRPVEYLAFTHQWEKQVVEVNPANHRTHVTVDLHAEGQRTRMDFRQTGLATEASRDSHIGGWCDSMDALDERLADAPGKGVAVQVGPARTDADWKEAVGLLKLVYVGEGYTTAEAAGINMVRERLESGGELLLARAQGGQLAGAVLHLHVRGPMGQVAVADEREFRLLAVDPEHRGKGIGRALVQACVERAVLDGASGMALWSQPSMVAAHSLYESMDFVRRADRDQDDPRGFKRLVFVRTFRPG